MDYHPDYPEIPILRATNNEMPAPGAFYVPRYGESLEVIAERAYPALGVQLSGGALTYGAGKINNSIYNVMNNVYRMTPSCTSMIVLSDDYLNTGVVHGRIAICNPLPTIWIPPLSTVKDAWEEPWNVDPYRIYVPQAAIERIDTSGTTEVPYFAPRTVDSSASWGEEEDSFVGWDEEAMYTSQEYMEAIPPDFEVPPEEDKTKTYIIIGAVAAAALVGGIVLLRRN